MGERNKFYNYELNLRFKVDPFVVGVCLPDVHTFNLFPGPEFSAVYLLHHPDQHVTLALAWEVEMPPCGLNISVT